MSNYEKVKCKVCGQEMKIEDFVAHAVGLHEEEVLELINDNTICEKLSDWV